MTYSKISGAARFTQVKAMLTGQVFRPAPVGRVWAAYASAGTGCSDFAGKKFPTFDGALADSHRLTALCAKGAA